MNKVLLVGILVLAAALRLWNLGSVPPSTSNDEASIGWNAYSVSKIGVDEYGEFPLLSQRAYDDWRRSTYLLLTIPFIATLGLTSIPIRLPAAILGILTVLATYHIVLLLFQKKSQLSQITALFASFCLAISPWHVYISRLGHESNAYLSFFVFGILFFLLGTKLWKHMVISLICFTLAMVSYYAGQVTVPLLAIGILCIYWHVLVKLIFLNRKHLLGFGIFCVVLIPIVWSLFSPKSLIRFHGTSALDPSTYSEEFAQFVARRNEAAASQDIVGVVLYNRRLFPVMIFFRGYLSHFDPTWLFTNSGKEPFKIPNMGLLNSWEIPFILIGMVAFIFQRQVDKRTKMLVFLWLLLSAVPASIATQSPHAMRAYVFVPLWHIFAAFGLGTLYFSLGRAKRVAAAGLLLLVIFQIRLFVTNYFIAFPKEQSQSFYYAIANAVPYVLAHEKNYDTIIFSNENNLYQSYMAFLYYSRYDPALYRDQGGTISGGFEETHRIGKYHFRPIRWQSEIITGKTLYIGNVSDFPADEKPIAVFRSLDGSSTVLAYEKNQ